MSIAFDIMQDEYNPGTQWKLADRPVQIECQLKWSIATWNPFRFICVCRRKRKTSAQLCTVTRQNGVHGDPVEPGTKRRFPAKAAHGLPRVDKRFLGAFFSTMDLA